MPCNSDYMNPTDKEVQISRVACLLDELDGKKFKEDHWEGYHPRVYNGNGGGVDGDKLVAKLCQKLQTVDVKKYSLEMQMWWRDHQAADQARRDREIDEKDTEAERRAALRKLTARERKLLGLDKL
jgi:hypothetical protein